MIKFRILRIKPFIVVSFGIQAEEKPSANISDDVEVIEVYGQIPCT